MTLHSRFLPLLLLPVLARPAGADEIDRRLRTAAAYIEGKTNDTSFLAGLDALAPEARKDLMSRLFYAPAPARALVLYELAAAGQEGAAPELDKLLREGSCTGRIRFPNVTTIEQTAARRQGASSPEIQGLAAGLLLARDNVPEDTASLNRAIQRINARESDAKVPLADRRGSVTTIGHLHLRKVTTEASQKALVKALGFKGDWEIRMRAATFLGVTGDPKTLPLLMDLLRSEDDPATLSAAVRTLATEGNYAPEHRWALVPELARMSDDFNLPDANRVKAKDAAFIITGANDAEAQLAKWKEKEKEFAKKPDDPPPAGAPPDAAAQAPKGDKPEPKAPSPTPAADPPAASPPQASDDADRECARWLLLARNYINQRNYEKAEEHARRALGKCQDGKRAEEAKELLKKIEYLKNL